MPNKTVMPKNNLPLRSLPDQHVILRLEIEGLKCTVIQLQLIEEKNCVSGSF